MAHSRPDTAPRTSQHFSRLRSSARIVAEGAVRECWQQSPAGHDDNWSGSDEPHGYAREARPITARPASPFELIQRRGHRGGPRRGIWGHEPPSRELRRKGV